jgi:hypothetical protein
MIFITLVPSSRKEGTQLHQRAPEQQQITLQPVGIDRSGPARVMQQRNPPGLPVLQWL